MHTRDRNRGDNTNDGVRNDKGVKTGPQLQLEQLMRATTRKTTPRKAKSDNPSQTRNKVTTLAMMPPTNIPTPVASFVRAEP